MPIPILMPALSPTMTEGNIATWVKKIGDTIKPGDIIQNVDQVDINTSEEILKLVDEAKNKNKSSILFLIKRGLNVRFIALPIN